MNNKYKAIILTVALVLSMIFSLAAHGFELHPGCVKTFYENTDAKFQSYVKTINAYACNSYYKTEAPVQKSGKEVCSTILGKKFCYTTLKDTKRTLLIYVYDTIMLYHFRSGYAVLEKSKYFPCFKENKGYNFYGYRDMDGGCSSIPEAFHWKGEEND